MKKQIVFSVLTILACLMMPGIARAATPTTPTECAAAGGQWKYVGGGSTLGCEISANAVPTTQAACTAAGGQWKYVGGGSTLGCDMSAVGATPTTQAACTAAGGQWKYVGGGSTLGCDMSSAIPRTEAVCRTAGGNWRYMGVAADGTEYGGYCDIETTPTPADAGAGEESNIETRTSRVSTDCAADDIDAENCGIVKLLDTAFNFISGGIALAVIGNIIFAGIQYSTAQGDPSKASKAKTRIQNAIIAFVMYLTLSAFIEWLIPGGVF